MMLVYERGWLHVLQSNGWDRRRFDDRRQRFDDWGRCTELLRLLFNCLGGIGVVVLDVCVVVVAGVVVGVFHLRYSVTLAH